jgi:nitronate monooxygenase
MTPSQHFMRQIGLDHPIIQAPMAGGTTTVALVAAVSAAGALGSFGAAYLTPEAIRAAATEARERTERPFAINLFLGGEQSASNAAIAQTSDLLKAWAIAYGLTPPGAPGPGIACDAQIAAVLDVAPRVFSFTFGAASPELIAACRSRGILTMGTATTLAEVKALDELGVDSICVQGMEAGGHRGTFMGAFEEAMIGTLPLLSLAVAATSRPVVAAGGIMNGAAIRAVLAAGASAASLGTAFLLAEEAGTPPAHRRMLAASYPRSTVITSVFSGRPARGITNRFHETLAPHGAELAPFPALNDMTREIRKAAAALDDPEAMSLWAGQGYPLARAMPAAELIATLAREAEEAARR